MILERNAVNSLNKTYKFYSVITLVKGFLALKLLALVDDWFELLTLPADDLLRAEPDRLLRFELGANTFTCNCFKLIRIPKD